VDFRKYKNAFKTITRSRLL